MLFETYINLSRAARSLFTLIKYQQLGIWVLSSIWLVSQNTNDIWSDRRPSTRVSGYVPSLRGSNEGSASYVTDQMLENYK